VSLTFQIRLIFWYIPEEDLEGGFNETIQMKFHTNCTPQHQDASCSCTANHDLDDRHHQLPPTHHHQQQQQHNHKHHNNHNHQHRRRSLEQQDQRDEKDVSTNIFRSTGGNPSNHIVSSERDRDPDHDHHDDGDHCQSVFLEDDFFTNTHFESFPNKAQGLENPQLSWGGGSTCHILGNPKNGTLFQTSSQCSNTSWEEPEFPNEMKQVKKEKQVKQEKKVKRVKRVKQVKKVKQGKKEKQEKASRITTTIEEEPKQRRNFFHRFKKRKDISISSKGDQLRNCASRVSVGDSTGHYLKKSQRRGYVFVNFFPKRGVKRQRYNNFASFMETDRSCMSSVSDSDSRSSSRSSSSRSGEEKKKSSKGTHNNNKSRSRSPRKRHIGNKIMFERTIPINTPNRCQEIPFQDSKYARFDSSVAVMENLQKILGECCIVNVDDEHVLSNIS